MFCNLQRSSQTRLDGQLPLCIINKRTGNRTEKKEENQKSRPKAEPQETTGRREGRPQYNSRQVP